MNIFNIHYRWLPRTIFPNLKQCFRSVHYGIENLIKWFPIIWNDRDWDWYYLAAMMEFKIRNMAGRFEKWGHYVGYEKDVKNMLECAELLKRLMKDDDNDWKKGDEYQRQLGKLLGKHLRSWWD